MRVALIAALAANGVIGRDGALPWRLPADLARFKKLTTGHPVVMGRKTHESIGRALPGRLNLVLTRGGSHFPGCETVASADAAIARAQREGASELWVIGGAAIYEAFLPLADRLELTHVEAEVEGDVRFPALPAGVFELAAQEAHPADERHEFAFRFATYRRAG